MPHFEVYDIFTRVYKIEAEDVEAALAIYHADDFVDTHEPTQLIDDWMIEQVDD